MLASVISFLNPRGKNKQQSESKWIAQDEKLVVMSPERKGAPPGLLGLYNKFKSLGTSGNDLKIDLCHSIWGKTQRVLYGNEY